jgi:hypothetical protein
MASIREEALKALKNAYTSGVTWVLFRHGSSTSMGWKRPTARSEVRGLMRSKDATPYIIRAQCIQHPSVFLARIKERLLAEENEYV